MANVRLLLAFGTHGDETGRCCNRAFFRDAVVPFANRCLADGRQVAIVHEAVPPRHVFRGYRGDGTDMDVELRAVQALLGMYMGKVNAQFAGALDHGGVPGNYYNIGFFRQVARMNIGGTRVHSFLEPVCAEAMYAAEKADELDSLPKMDLNTAMEYLEALARSIVLRDRKVLELTLQLARKGYDAIIIPRGVGHNGMKVLFDREIFDITVLEDRTFRLIEPKREFVRRSYAEGMTRVEMEYWARKHIGFNEEMDRLFATPFGRIMNVGIAAVELASRAVNVLPGPGHLVGALDRVLLRLVTACQDNRSYSGTDISGHGR